MLIHESGETGGGLEKASGPLTFASQDPEVRIRKNILLVTYHDEDCEEGLSYAIDPAKLMNKGVTVLFICRRNLTERFADVMTSVTFAEAGEHETAKNNMQAAI